jgi:hypothetical protein
MVAFCARVKQKDAGNAMEAILIGRKDAARLLGISVRSLDHAVATGLLKPRRLGRRVMFSPEELRRFAARDHVRLAPAVPEGRDDCRVPDAAANAANPFALSGSLPYLLTVAFLWITAAYLLVRMPKAEQSHAGR